MAQSSANVHIGENKRGKTRPHESITGFNDWRSRVNLKSQIREQPFKANIESWNLKQEMLQVTSLRKERKVIFIDTEDLLADSVDVIMKNKEITVHCEISSGSYFPIVSMIQISTEENDYSIDCLNLFDKMKIHLGKIFENSEILKVFHNDFKLNHLQTNFDLSMIGGIDAQEAYTLINPKCQSTSLQQLFRLTSKDDILEIEIQQIDWLIRPIPKNLLQYATQKTQQLFKSWIEIKENLLFIEHEPFPLSRQICLQTGYERKTAIEAWQLYINISTEFVKRFFSTIGQRELFISLFNWREMTAKNSDINPDDLLSMKDLKFLTRAMPESINRLRKLISSDTLIDKVQMQELLDLIKKVRDSIPVNKMYGETPKNAVLGKNMNKITLSMTKRAQKLRRYRLNKKQISTNHKRH